MNKFCEDCVHRQVPKILKEKFNLLNYPLFVNDQPINDEKITGCTVKFVKINWPAMYSFIQQKGLLTRNEKRELAKTGWLTSNGD